MRKFSSLILVSLIAILALGISGQNFPEPRTETLLNDLKVQIFPQPNTGKISINLRLHRGTAFDPVGRDGAMALLIEVLFPLEETQAFFKDELGGDFAIKYDHDLIEIDASSDTEHFITMLETIASQLTNPVIDADGIARAKAAHLERLNSSATDSQFVADRAAAQKLFGDYPYGRSSVGTKESIEKVEYADLILMKQRFLAADNATLAIVGDVKSAYAYKAARRMMGNWQKRTEKIPATFRLPDPPDSNPTEIVLVGAKKPSSAYKIIAARRSSDDFFPTEILATILNERAARASSLKIDAVESDANLLRGVLTAYVSSDQSDIKSPFATLLKDPIAKVEFDSAKRKLNDKYLAAGVVTALLDVDTFDLGSVESQFQKIQNVKISDVNRVAKKALNAPVAIAIVKVEEDESTIPLPADPKDPE